MRVLLCRPCHYQITYRINPWMQVGQVKPELAMRQWEHLKRVYEDLGIDVAVIKQVAGLPDMVFATDQGIPDGHGGIVMSQFRYKQRRGETEHYRAWFESQGIALKEVGEGHFFEGGGECLFLRNMIMVGTGFRTNRAGTRALASCVDKTVVPMELIDKRFYHLDTCLFVLDAQTVFYYPRALSRRSARQLYDLVPEVVEFSVDEALRFAANSVVVGQHVIMQAGNDWLAGEVIQRGYTPVMVDVSEFIKAGGGIHCLTFWLPD